MEEEETELRASVSDSNSVSLSSLVRASTSVILSQHSHEDFQCYEHELLQVGWILVRAFNTLSGASTITILQLVGKTSSRRNVFSLKVAETEDAQKPILNFVLKSNKRRLLETRPVMQRLKMQIMVIKIINRVFKLDANSV